MKHRNIRMLVIATILTMVVFPSCYAQKKTKTFQENFNVGKETVLEINTSYSDLEFETWNRNQVAIVAIVEIEGATEEEATTIFSGAPIKIMGNSKKIEISTGSQYRSQFPFTPDGFREIHGDVLSDLEGMRHEIEMEVLPKLPEVPELPELPEIMEIPPLPPINMQPFDYEAYKKDGAAYMKEWKKEFDKSFSQEYQDSMEEWSARMEIRREKLRERHRERAEEQREAMEERREKMEEARKNRMEAMEASRKELREELAVRRNELRESVHGRVMEMERESPSQKHRHGPNVFYFSEKGSHRNYKIKISIKIKLPKNMKIKMNVRHGEVKLAESGNNIEATLSYASLWANDIAGDQTSIKAFYSPLSVERWNEGRLRADYSEKVTIKEVGKLSLSATFSDITIESLLSEATIKNDFGPLDIQRVSKDLKSLDIKLQNAELRCKLPSSPYTISVTGTHSEVVLPKGLSLQKVINGPSTSYTGYKDKKDSGTSISVNSHFSEVALH